MQAQQPHISVITVNYNVKEYLANLLTSIEKAAQNLDVEIFVIDNASTDGSKEMIPAKFPHVKYVYNMENIGFGKANNQAIALARGKYCLMVNPDAVVSEDTLEVMFQHLEANPDAGAAGCKILNPDGSFAPESRRSVPGIRSAAFKVLGLQALFPKSKFFGGYYLGWMDENTPSAIPVLSGSFMFYRTEVLREIGGFDERFFMYGEDIDLCYRTSLAGYRIDYVPSTSIIHYKGESSRKNNYSHVIRFNRALYQFFEKHHSLKYSLLFKGFIFVSIWLRAIIFFVLGKLKDARHVALDLGLLNATLFGAFWLRFFAVGELQNKLENPNLIWVYAILSVLFFLAAFQLRLFSERNDSISAVLKAVVFSYLGVVIITFFIRELAFSRVALALGFVLGALGVSLVRFWRINRNFSLSKETGRFRPCNVLIAGSGKTAEKLKKTLHSLPRGSYNVVGLLHASENEGIQNEVIGTLSQIDELIDAYKVEQVFFVSEEISYKQMLQIISRAGNQKIVFKIVSESMEFVLGKSHVEYLDTLPTMDVQFPLEDAGNRLMKRAIDVIVSFPVFIFFGFFCGFGMFSPVAETCSVGGVLFKKPLRSNRADSLYRMFKAILVGKWSLVGAPVPATLNDIHLFKPGFTGLVHINRDRIENERVQERFELHYVQNYSVWMDIDILARHFIKGISTLEFLDRNSGDVDS